MRGRGIPGGAFIFLLRVRGAFFFLLWVRPCPGLGRSGGIQWGVGRPAGGCFFFLLAGGRHRASTAERHPGSATRLFFCCGCASSGGARLLFCCGCAARFCFAVGARQVHLLPAASEHPLQKDIQGPRRVYSFAAGARAHLLTHSLAARRPESTNSKKHTNQKTRVPARNARYVDLTRGGVAPKNHNATYLHS